jgi:gliding motility-associated-like protein
MNTNSIIKKVICSVLLVVSIVFSHDLNAQLAAIDGGNIDFMASTPPTFDGWTARTGTYSSGSSTAGNSTYFNFTTSWATPSSATFSSYGSSSNAFAINTNTNEKDANSGNKLKKIPTELGFTRSVRLGPTEFGGVCAELEYRLKINDTNCLLTFCYAMVLTVPHVGDKYINPTFEVDVVDNSGNLVDDCCFFQNCGDINTNNLPSGWHKGSGGSYDEWIYCDWQQITINLSANIGQTVSLRVRTSGCAYSAHAGYGYFTAKVDKPTITLSGCAGEGDTVTLAEVPSGFGSYEWFEITEGTTDQFDIDNIYSAGATIVDSNRIFAITNTLMDNQDNKSFAVRLTSPTQHVSWDNSPAPACVTYIPIDVHDMRPKFDNMLANTYIPTSPESDIDEIGFLFGDVVQRNTNYPLDWHLLDFGDGDSLEFTLDAEGFWHVDEASTPLAENHCRIAYKADNQTPDTVFHVYQTGEYTFTRCAHSFASDPTDTLECTKCYEIPVVVPVRPTLTLTCVDTACYNDKVTVTASSADATASTYTYQWWYSDDDTDNVEPFFTGTNLVIDNITENLYVKVMVMTPEGFYRWGRDTIIVQQFPDITIEGDTMICIGERLHLTATDNNNDTYGMKWSYQMPNDNTIIDKSSNQVIFEDAVQQDTTIFVVATTTHNCRAWKSKRIIVVRPVVTSNKKEICVGDDVILTGSGAVDYSWSASPKDESLQDSVKGLNPVTVSPKETTRYTMTGYGQNGCTTDVNIVITIVPDPVIKFGFSPSEVDMQEPFVMFTDSSDYSTNSEWTFSDGGTAEGGQITYEFTSLNTDSVSVHLISSNRLGCSSEADTTLPIVLFAVWMPNAFSPDGDGINDYFFFMSENDLEDVIFEVFDRWGTKMYSYENKHYENNGSQDMQTLGWDGTYKGEYVQNGVYAYRFTYRRPGNTRVYDKSGTVALVR